MKEKGNSKAENKDELLNYIFKRIRADIDFMLDKNKVGSDDLTPVLIYIIIKAKPKRMFFNIKFINYFFDEKYKKGINYCYITQAIFSLNYIMNELKTIPEPKNKTKRKNSDKDDGAAPTPQKF